MEANTSNLQIEDTAGFFAHSFMGLFPNDQTLGDCFVTIGSWSDTQIIVLLDDTGLVSCSNIKAGDKFNVTVFSTDGGAQSNKFATGPAVAPGAIAQITQLTPASGPVSGGTFTASGATDPNGTITVTGSGFAGASTVWFGNGGSLGGIATTDFTVSADGSSLTVRPPPAPGNFAQGLFVAVTTPAGTSDVQCLAIDSGCQGTYFYQSPSDILPAIDSGPIDPSFNGTLSLDAAIPQKNGTCPGSSPAGGTGISFSANLAISGGPISFSGTPQTSTNLGVLSSVQAPITVNVASPVTITVTLSGQVSGCYKIPIPDLNIPGLGGLFVVIGGNLSANYTLTVTLNQGSWIVDAGYVANQLKGAMIPAGSQNCVDGNGAAAPCIVSSSAASISGTLVFSPLWFGIDIEAGPITVAAGAGLTVTAFLSVATDTGVSFDVCAGGTYAAAVSAGPVAFSVQGTFFGPFNIFGDGSVCPLGAIGAGLPATSVSVASSANPSSVGQQVTYTATVSPTDNSGTVSFADNGAVLAACESAPVDANGQATCAQTYTSAGPHSIVAAFSGDAAFAGSASNPLVQQVNAAAAAPVVTSVAPASGVEAGGTSVTVTGTGFTGATDVGFGATPATSFTVVSDTEITAVSPPGTGMVDVRVTGPGGTSAVSAGDQFTYTAAAAGPVVTSLAPPSGVEAGGTSVTVTGTGFTGATGVSFGATAATSFTVVSDTEITAVSPPGTGVVDVTVTGPAGTSPVSAGDQFTYTAAAAGPVVTSLAPSSGVEAGGTSVTVTGTGFTGATGVSFGATPATSFTVVSDTEITAVSPPGTGVVDVTVTGPGGTSRGVGG